MISPADRERVNMGKVVYITVVCFYFFGMTFVMGQGEGRHGHSLSLNSPCILNLTNRLMRSP